MTHPNLRKRDKESQRREIMDGRRAVEDTIGRPTRGFRAPYHCLNATTVEVLNEEGFCFDASMLYFRYDPGRLQSLKPTWFREWMPLYGTLGLNPETTFGIFRWLVKRHQLSILPAHPQYSGRDETLARAFGNFLKWARDGGATFWSIDRWLHAHRNIPLPEWMPEPRAGELR